MKDILNSSDSTIKKHIHQLADEYKKQTGISACLSCSGDVQRMLNYLKNLYNMTQFELIKPNVIYKIKWGSGLTISNSNMTDELAIEFLKAKPSRIELFSKYPENYKELIGEKSIEKEETISDDIVEEIVKESSKKPCKGCKEKRINNKKTTRKRTTKK